MWGGGELECHETLTRRQGIHTELVGRKCLGKHLLGSPTKISEDNFNKDLRMTACDDKRSLDLCYVRVQT
jgi:hypothetical protein